MARNSKRIMKPSRAKLVKGRKSSKPKMRRTRSPSIQNNPAAYDIEGILVDKILGNRAIPENGTSIENLIYNATPKVAEIGYSYGFSIGRELCMKQKEDQKFTNILDRIGLVNALYYPLKDSLIITSRSATSMPKKVGHSVHVYEAGVISGYLSMSTGLKMGTIEKRCVHNGSDVCQFISIPMSSRSVQSSTDLNNIVESIAHAITDNDFKKQKNEYYRIMAYLPLMKQPMNEQVRKLLVMSGERISEYSDKKDTKRIINNIVNYFGAKDAEISMRKTGKSIIKLRFESYNSIYPYVSMPTAIIVGFVSNAFNKSAEVSISTNKNKTYTTTIDFKANSA